MGKFLKNLQVLCTTAFMATVLAVNVSAAIPEENILLEIDDNDVVSSEEESYKWHEGWGTDEILKGEINCIKEDAKIRFSLTSDEGIEYFEDFTGEKKSNAVLTGTVFKLDGDTITHGSDIQFQESLSTDVPVEIDFSQDGNFYNGVSFYDYNQNYVTEDAFNRKDCLYVFIISDNNDTNVDENMMMYVVRIAGDSTSTEPVTPETTTPKTTTTFTEPVTPKIAAPEVVTPQTSVGGKFTAIPHTIPISITENATTIRSYSINNTDYFSLRDIASLLNGTEKQFDIQYDKSTKTVALTTQKPYALANMDYTSSNDMAQKEVTSTIVILNVDGQNISSVAYNINGTNYDSNAELNKFIAIVD